MGVTGSRQAGEKTSLTVYKRHGQGPETAPTLQQDWRPQLPKDGDPPHQTGPVTFCSSRCGKQSNAATNPASPIVLVSGGSTAKGWRACGGSRPRQVPEFACLWRCGAWFAKGGPCRLELLTGIRLASACAAGRAVYRRQRRAARRAFPKFESCQTALSSLWVQCGRRASAPSAMMRSWSCCLDAMQVEPSRRQFEAAEVSYCEPSATPPQASKFRHLSRP